MKSMRNGRIWWITTLAVLITVAAVPALRNGALVQWLELRGVPDSEAIVRFVDRYYPDDPEMLLASGINDGRRLRQAITKGAGPAAWAAYVSTLPDIPCNRVGGGGIDPEDKQGIRDMEKLVTSNDRRRPTTQDARSLLEALRGWEAADPQNGLPVALESIVLYSLCRDKEALSRWQEAGRLPAVTAYTETVRQALTRLYQQMGVPEPQALVIAAAIASCDSSKAKLRNGARIAIYEGRLAQIQGRPGYAVALWDATAGIGDRLASDGTDMGFLVGAAIQVIGAQPAWQWASDSDTGTRGGIPVRVQAVSPDAVGYHLWYGPQHAFYVSAAGTRASDELRDRLVEARVRLSLMGAKMPDPDALTRRMAPAWSLPQLGLGAAILCAQLLLLFGLAHVGRRQRVDDAGAMRAPTWRGAVLTAPLVVGIAWAAVTWRAYGAQRLDPSTSMWVLPSAVSFAVLVLAGIGARLARGEAGTLAVWRMDLQRALPVVMALTALTYLVVSAYSVRAQNDLTPFLREDEALLVQRLGPGWEHPLVPPDAWRAAYPSKKTAKGNEHQ